jgi:hypothetical protein
MESDALGVTTVLQTRVHPSQQNLFDLLGTHCPPPSPVFFKFIHPGYEHQLWYGRNSPGHKMYTMLFFPFIPVWNTSCGMGGISPSNNTVINLCATSFLLNHDPELRISPQHCRRLVPLQGGQRAIQPPGAAGVSTPAKDTAPVPSDDEGGAAIISPEQGDSDQASSPTLPLETLPSQGRA